MERNPRLTVDLQIPAQQIKSNLKFYNEDIEKQVEEGVNMAIKELQESTNIAEIVKEQIKEKLHRTISDHVMSWEVQKAIRASITDSISKKITEYADTLGAKIFDLLPPEPDNKR